MGKVNNNGISAKDFATQIKAKYPEYKDVDDLKLATAMIEKYPTYKDSVYFDTPVEKKIQTVLRHRLEWAFLWNSKVNLRVA